MASENAESHEYTEREQEEEDLLEPIAVCGISLKFPQDACTEQGLWTMINEKRNAMSEFPPDRLNIDAFHGSFQRNTLRTRGGHFLREDIGLFDAGFFSITPSEAAGMDPMQRILLETTFHAFESCGLRIEDIRGSRTSVHVGCFTSDYLQLLMKDSVRLPPYAAMSTQSMLANRLSWFFDLRGPSVNLDSACSSSAMAIDLACQLLHTRKTDMALVAGCNILLDPDFSIALNNMQMLSPDGKCFAFDHRGNGYSRGEGVAVVVLKRLSDALTNNDPIRAIIRAVACNQDGRTPGITQPDANAQARLIHETYDQAGLSMKHTRFFEAHGTGTAIGDPIEVAAIAECFRKHRTAEDPLHVGSIKTNIGHLEGAAGIAGFIKAVLAVECGVIPPNVNFESINRRLAAYDCFMALPQDCVSWPSCTVRRASVNSFGYGGTNCHIIVDDANSYLSRKRLSVNPKDMTGSKTGLFSATSDLNAVDSQCQRGKHMNSSTSVQHPKLLVWSASTKAALGELIGLWKDYCLKVSSTVGTIDLADVAYTLDSRRSALCMSSFAIVSTVSDFLNLSDITSIQAERPQEAPRIAFIFTGQGAQWYAMGRELFIFPTYEKLIQRCETILQDFGCPWSVQDEMLKDEDDSKIDDPSLAQTLTTVLQIGLVGLLRYLGVHPVATLGHSMGEIAAAYCAGHLNLKSALCISYYRGLFTSLIPEKTEYTGAMVAVGLSAEAVTNLLEKIGNTTHSFAGSLRVSCINSPINCTVSGDVQLIRLLEEMLKRESIFCRRLRVPVAYHSPQMELIVSDCLRHFEGLSPGKSLGDIAMISSVTGALLNPRDACNPGYWVSNMVSPVLFLQAMNHLCQDSGQLMRNKLDGSHHDRINVDHILEIGPHSALRSPIQETLRTMTREKEIPYFSALRKNHSATSTLLQLLGELHCRGTAVNLRRINDPDPYFDTSRVALVHAPRYPFDHSTKYWSESPIVRNYRLRAHGHVELLGSPSRDWNPMAPEWRCWVCPADILWLLDHKINGKAIYPAAAMLVMAMQGASQLMKPNSNLEGFTFRHVNLKSPIVIAPDSTNVETRLQLMPLRSESTVRERTWSFTVYSVVEGHWNENCDGTITAHWNTAKSSRADMEPSLHYRNSFSTMSSQCTDFIDHQTIYRNLNNRGHQYGKAFQGILGAYHDRKAIVIADVTAQTQLDRGASHGPFMPHTTTIDAFMQVALVSSGLSGTDIPTQAITHIDKLWVACQNVQPSFDKFQVLAKSEAATPRTRTYSGFATGPDDMVTLILDGLQTTVVSNDDSLDTTAVKRRSWYTIWTAVDVDMLSGRDISNWLDSICGPDPDGPQNFCRMLRSYLYSKSSSLHQHMETSGRPSKPHFAKYADWIEWHVNQPQHYPPTEDEFALASQLSHEGSVGKFFVTISENALDVLEGRQDMVQLLFKDNLAETFYEQQLSGSLYYQKLQTYLEAFSFKHPNMDFLEIGAGTGSFTRRILEAIQPSSQDDTARLNSYYFTDVSPAFFDRAQETFSGVAGKMKFAVLDADQDPLAQGFCEHTFDVIAASNVLHVTRNLNTTLRRLRSLLKPGGKLLLHEYVRPERIEVGFVFGLLPGWWPSAEDGRHRSPLQTEEMWDTLLRHNGFSGLDFILPDFQDEESHMMSIMCATAVHSDPPEFLPRVVIAIETNSTLQRSIAEALQARLGLGGCDQVAIVELATATVSPVAFEALVTLFDLETPLLSRMDETGFESLKALLLSAPKTLWVSNGSNSNSDPGYGMVDGFAKVFRLENINATMATLALAFNSTCEENSMAFIESALQQLLLAEGLDQPEDYIVRDGRLHVRRIQEDTTFGDKMTRNLSGIDWQTKTVQTARPFVVSSENVFPRQALRIFESPLADSDLNPGEVELEIHAVGLNEVDEFLMCGKAFGLDIGRECAGVVTRVGSDCMFTPGDRVCAYGTNMLRSIGRSKQDMIARIPQHLPFDEASTLPQDYLVAGHIVRELRLRHDDFLVICGGHTRLGIATLHTLEVMDVSLFAMVTTEQEGALLTAEIPRIVCFDTRRSNTRFKEVFPSIPTMVLDFVNTNLVELAQYLPSSGQIFSVKVGTDGSSNPLKSISIPDTVSYRVLNIMQILQNASIGLQIPHCVLEPAFEKKALTRSKVQTLKLSELGTLSEVFKGLHADQRPSIRYEAEDEINVYQRMESTFLLSSRHSYLIAGGLGDLGCCVARWMARRGARSLILLSRSGARTETAKAMITDLEALGVKIRTPLCDVGNLASLREALQQCSDMAAIKGCVQASGNLKDVMYNKMSFEDWQVATHSKVRGSWNLHEILPKGMDFFIMAASISGIVGQATQINYAAANTYQDALARFRLAEGEKAVSLDLGILATGGLLSQRKGLLERLEAEGIYSPLSEHDILALFEHFCNPGLTLDEIHQQVVSGIISPALQRQQSRDLPLAFLHPFWSQTLFDANTSKIHEGTMAETDNITISLARAGSFGERVELSVCALADQFCSLSLTPRANIDLEKPFHVAGADSLSAVYLRNWIVKQFGVNIAIFDILGDISITMLGHRIIKQWCMEHDT